MIYFTADFHFGHTKIIEYCNRPFTSAKEMDRVLINNYNSIVTDKDIVFIVGDLTMAGNSHKDYIRNLLSDLNGQKHLILGNHDQLKPFDYIELGITTVHTALLMPNQLALVHDPAVAEVDKTKTWLCGHIHTLFKMHNYIINVGVDVWNYHPVSIEVIESLIKDRDKALREEKRGGYTL